MKLHLGRDRNRFQKYSCTALYPKGVCNTLWRDTVSIGKGVSGDPLCQVRVCAVILFRMCVER